MKYFHIIRFLLTRDLTFLKECLEIEFIGKKFSLCGLIKSLISKPNKYLFWYRLCYEMNNKGSKKQKKTAKKINDKLKVKYNVDIDLRAEVQKGLNIWHVSNIVITGKSIIGKNLQLASGVVIGFKDYKNVGIIVIGDNVQIGSNSVIFGQKIKIGNNVNIGAMSFVNKDIPDDCTVYTEKTNKIIVK